MRIFIKAALPILIIMFFTSIPGAKDYDFYYEGQASLTKDTEFFGAVYIKEKLRVPKGVTLTIRAGTVIRFGHPGLSDDGNVDSSIIVEGRISAVGTRAAPIVFTSAQARQKSAFGEIYLSEAKDSTFEFCNFLYSHWGLHVHESNVTVRNCLFKETFGGIRFKGDTVTAINNEFVNSDVSFRFWQASPVIVDNRFVDVTTAIFAREQVKAPVITGNTFRGTKDYYIKLGELQEDDITLTGSDFGTTDKKEISAKIFDKEDEDYIGRVIIK